jgi:hypothetical protein
MSGFSAGNTNAGVLGLRCRDILSMHENILRFMSIGWSTQLILRLLSYQFEKLQYWYYWWEIHDICCWDGSGRHDIHTMLHDNSYVNSYNTSINVISSQIKEAGMLVLLMAGNYEVCRSDDDIATRLHEEICRRSWNVTALLRKVERL